MCRLTLSLLLTCWLALALARPSFDNSRDGEDAADNSQQLYAPKDERRRKQALLLRALYNQP